MKLAEERIRSRIRQRIKQQRPAWWSPQLKINLDSECYQVNTKHYRNKFSFPRNVLIEEIGWEAYEWQRI
jgi:hypothetical protein